MSACEEGWERNGTTCYFWSTDAKSWSDAEDFCKEKGAHLASVTSSAINDYILGGKVRRDISRLWVGGTDAEVEDVWKWTDCSPWEFTLWDRDQPDNGRISKVGQGQHCLFIHSDNRWNDRECEISTKYRFLCSVKICSK